jgi:hypothetical protein
LLKGGYLKGISILGLDFITALRFEKALKLSLP